jgi:hypothetical protein
VSPDDLVPHNHPLRPIRALVNAALDRLSRDFAAIYSDHLTQVLTPLNADDVWSRDVSSDCRKPKVEIHR